MLMRLPVEKCVQLVSFLTRLPKYIQVQKDFGVPVEKQRYWLWAKRQNHTFRPNRPLLPVDEAGRIMDVKDNTAAKHAIADLKLFLEPLLPNAELCKIDKCDILLFFKFYIPETQVVAS